VTSSGQYRIEIPELGRSHPFVIRENLLEGIALQGLKAFYYQRASTPIEKQYAGEWNRPAGHPDTLVRIHPSAASPGRSADALIASPKGWYDAGDYNKYIVNSGFTVGVLLSLYEDFPEAVKQQHTGIPESGNATPDLLDEVYWNIDWMLNMQDPADGGVYHKLTEPEFEGFIQPADCRKPRYVVAKSVTASLDFAASMAQASRVYAGFEDDCCPGLAGQALQAAQSAFDWAVNHPDALYSQRAMNEKFDPDISTGEYGDRSAADEFFWAAVELYLATHDGRYLKTALAYEPPHYTLPTWGRVGGLGSWSLIRYAGTLDGQAQLLADRARAQLLAYTDSAMQDVETAPWNAPYGRSARDFFWGCNSDAASNQGITFLYAWLLTNDRRYLANALHNMDYLLGRNATGYCYVTGWGHKSPQNPHHRLSASDGVAAPIPGFLVGGPNPGKQDRCAYPSDIPDECYTDVTPAYAANEIAINWQSLFTGFATALNASLQSKD
jgi:endoglucanase